MSDFYFGIVVFMSCGAVCICVDRICDCVEKVIKKDKNQ